MNSHQIKFNALIKRSSGVSFVEAALTLPVILFLLMFFVDVSRYVFVSMVLNFAAHKAVDYAAKLEMDVDIADGKCEEDPTTCSDYLTRVESIVAIADQYSGLIASDSPNSRVQRTSYTMYNPDVYTTLGQSARNLLDASISSVVGHAALIRPGEAANITGNNTNVIQHAFRSLGTNSDQGMPDEEDGESWASIFDEYPLMLRIQVSFEPITPFFPQNTITVTEYAFSKSKKYGNTAPGKEPAAVSTSTPSPLPTGVVPTPTPVPTTTRTPTITPTPRSCVDAYCLSPPPGACGPGGPRCYECRDCPGTCPCPNSSGQIG